MYYSFPQNLKRLRKASRLTQAQLAEMIGVTQSTLSTYESGVVYPAVDKLYDIARVLEIDVVELIQ